MGGGCDGPQPKKGHQRAKRPKRPLPMKLAAECSMCPMCEEPFCDECNQHYADCAHPGPHSEDEDT